jgi:putative MFS transporter
MTLDKENKVWWTVMVAALGYFVDIYDIQLFNLVSKASLKGIGITDLAEIDRLDYVLFLRQMAGMMVGGIVWGIIGDRFGRKSVLFGSILMYSLANILNGFVSSPEQYAVLRFIAGFGLAGELGAAITLVSELMTKENRGWGTMIIVAMGALGAVAAATITKMCGANWQLAYFIGGGLGLLLLALRFGTFESGMFENMKASNVSKGNFLMIFQTKERFLKYLACILLGLPIWFSVGILIKFSPAIGKITQVTGDVKIPDAVMACYIGISFGDLLCGWMSQLLKSRKKIVVLYLIFGICTILTILFSKGLSPDRFVFLCFILGTCSGYWALFVTIASEQFGTNIRATVTTTVPNFVRGAVIPITLSFKSLEPAYGTIQSASIVGTICLLLAFLSILYLQETFGKNLDYLES